MRSLLNETPPHHQIIMKMKQFCFEMIHELLNWCYWCYWNCARSVDIKMCSFPSMPPPPDPFFTFVFLLTLSPNYKFVFLNKLWRPTSAKDKLRKFFPIFDTTRRIIGRMMVLLFISDSFLKFRFISHYSRSKKIELSHQSYYILLLSLSLSL